MGRRPFNYYNYIAILKAMKEDTLTAADLDSIQIDTLQSIASNCKHFPRAWARNLLDHLNNDPQTWYREPIPMDNPPQRRERPSISSKSDISNNLLNLYPNPASEYFAIDYEVNEEYKELRLDIMDVLGKIIFSKKLIRKKNQELKNIQEYKPGYYVVHLIGDGKVVISGKLNVIK